MPALSFWLLLSACSHDADAPTLRAPPPPGPRIDVGSLLPGGPLVLELSGFNPSERVYLARGGAATGAGPCLPAAGGLCLDIAGPVQLMFTVTTNAAGEANRTLTVPPSVPPGAVVGFQAVALRGAGGTASVATPGVTRVAGLTHASELSPGDVLLSEVQRDPTPIAPELGGWVELTNTSGLAIDLGGVAVATDSGGQFELPQPTPLAAGERLVLGNETDPLLNGGVPVDLAWGTSIVFNPATDDGLRVAWNGLDLDALAWTAGSPWPAAPGAAMSLDGAVTDPVQADSPFVWCSAPTPPGTPGDPNPPCPIDPCGDGVLDPGEGCDDGGRAPGDGCDAACQVEACPIPEAPRRKLTIADANPVAAGQTPDGDVWTNHRYSPGGGAPTRAQLIRRDGATLAADWSYQYHDTSSVSFAALAAHPAGGVWAGGGQLSDLLMVHVAGDGAVVTTGRYDAAPFDSGSVYDLDTGPDGTVFVAASLYDLPQDDAVAALLAIAPDGAVRFGLRMTEYTDAEEYATVVLALRDGGVLLLVDVEDEIVPRTGNSGMWAARFDAAGVAQWARVAVYADIVPTSAAELADGTLILGGWRNHTNETAWAAALAADGTPLWSSGINPRSLRIEEAFLSVAPATCPGTVVDGDACAAPGTQCAGSTGVCACDGTWQCGTRSPRIALWGNEGYLLDLDGDLLSSWGTTSLAPLASFARPDGGFRAWRTAFTWFDTDRDLIVPCDTTPVVPIAVNKGFLTWSDRTIAPTTTPFTRSPEDTQRTTGFSAAPSTDCSDLSCP